MKIKSCPFCGEMPKKETRGCNKYIACENDDCFCLPQTSERFKDEFKTFQDVVKAWNTRKGEK